jgi:hypothetical protein
MFLGARWTAPEVPVASCNCREHGCCMKGVGAPRTPTPEAAKWRGDPTLAAPDSAMSMRSPALLQRTPNFRTECLSGHAGPSRRLGTAPGGRAEPFGATS